MRYLGHVLLVEDNAGDVELVEDALVRESRRCTLSVMRNGRAALNYLHCREPFAGAIRPDIILLDLNLPVMSGLEVLDAAKQDAQLSTIPIVMLTSSKRPSDILECYRRHANCYIVKPFEGPAFLSAIEQVVTFWLDTAKLPPH
jgi:CheY-like chemotaxis protein